MSNKQLSTNVGLKKLGFVKTFPVFVPEIGFAFVCPKVSTQEKVASNMAVPLIKNCGPSSVASFPQKMQLRAAT